MSCGDAKGLAIQENHPYQDFVWKQDIGNFKLKSRFRMEQQIRETTALARKSSSRCALHGWSPISQALWLPTE